MSTSHYRAELVKLMSLKDDKTRKVLCDPVTPYDVLHNFTTEELLSITTVLVCRWMNERAYGDPETNDDMRPIHAASAFMPRLNTTWDPVTKQARSGVSKDFVNLRGRWRTRKGVVDAYIDNTQPYPDAYTAAVLAGPTGPCFTP
ncbi:hypothetical protein F441_15691 [Phytophthora nicotianae CJ01A1]|uniref:Uncharacterized protein n=2 Tax=Phytophthora nicotianae TaxID=4792 RepID=V9EGS0_PHYNI|nr:hypothetical protein F443_15858 [Phytophthora nicotianae P1569]ETP08287.1 hypothetical protein F441_15691 [Phytophthora nicotianae CJ01A1]